MSDVRRSRRSGQRSAPPSPPPPPLDLTDPEAFKAWLARLDSAAQDIIAAAEDQVRSPGERDLGRRAARAIVADGASSLDSLIACARAGLPAA